jgi:GNAT superfamily N-acetyltransferase
MRIREIEKAERPLYADHLKRLDPADRRMRFFGPTPDSVIDAHVERLPADSILLVAEEMGRFVAGAELHRYGNLAEFAVSVDPEHRGRGLARRLLVSAIELARSERAAALCLLCLASNHPMMRLARDGGMNVVRKDGEIRASLDLAA